MFLLLACKPACNDIYQTRECKDGDCVCKDGYQEIPDCFPEPNFDGIYRCECEKGRKITDIRKLHYITLNCFYF